MQEEPSTDHYLRKSGVNIAHAKTEGPDAVFRASPAFRASSYDAFGDVHGVQNSAIAESLGSVSPGDLSSRGACPFTSVDVPTEADLELSSRLSNYLSVDESPEHSSPSARKASKSLRLFEPSTTSRRESKDRHSNPQSEKSHNRHDKRNGSDRLRRSSLSKNTGSALTTGGPAETSKTTTATYIPHHPSSSALLLHPAVPSTPVSSRHLRTLPHDDDLHDTKEHPPSHQTRRSSISSASSASSYSVSSSAVTSASTSFDNENPFFNWDEDFPITVQLEPFKHQVGGHTAFFRFSKRAVCKPLTRNENSFYETIEQRYPALLPFIPRYIGVLNVTHTFTDTEEANAEQGAAQARGRASDATNSNQSDEVKRIVSHRSFDYIPEVSVEQNRHIFPEWMFHHHHHHHCCSDSSEGDHSPSVGYHKSSSMSGLDSGSERPFTDSQMEKQRNWGTTVINRKLREQVLREVFAPRRTRRNGNSDCRCRRCHHHRHVRPPVYREQTISVGSQNHEVHRKNRIESEEMNMPLPKLSSSVGRNATSIPMEETDEETGGLSDSHAHTRCRRYSSDAVWEDQDADDYPSLSERVAQLPSYRRSSKQEAPVITDDQDTMFDMDTETVYGGDVPPPLESPKLPQEPIASKQLSVPESLEHKVAPTKAKPIHPSSSLAADESAQVHAQTKRTQIERYIVIEDLTSGMKRPCVLDLKMGTRQYGIMANEKKRASQSKKCAMTTSRELGVRICGMQVWHRQAGSYTFEDKYAGRDIKAGEEFQQALMRFLGKGESDEGNENVQVHHIPVILRKLRELERIIRSLKGSRLYASSLLFIYDGEPPNESSDDDEHRVREIDIRIVDFANCVFAEDKEALAKATCPPQHRTAHDRGYVRGLRTLRLYFQKIWRQEMEHSIYEHGHGAEFSHDSFDECFDVFPEGLDDSQDSEVSI
ncbi:inositol polyphosphate kinase [Schizosaccharomyces japonicus yFS275]|uniref:Kinase n=1 Tax=Schizosaccharomyces japonicus (strain yFS275 / FY16936) TaxID=402676 RepID=B6K256_SCHJY|nr:inositol polyphosphate kinase [Schizosaccharomyces japonicus yFS275]EEB07237.1 inositol polyphosphate kinase [Schizosaccharomyces japonicus yFS275]